MGYARPPEQDYPRYRMLADGHGGEIHLQASPAGWVDPPRNPFGVYLYTDRVDALAESMRARIIEPGKAPEHKPWGMYEMSLHGPDGLLVRVGWPIAELRPAS